MRQSTWLWSLECILCPLSLSVEVPPDYLTLESSKEGDPDKRETLEEADKRCVSGCVFMCVCVCTDQCWDVCAVCVG